MLLERRKTTTGAKLYATLDDHYKMMMGITDDDDQMADDYFQPAPPRPVSWHPISSHCNVPLQQSEQLQPQSWSRHDSSSSGDQSASSSDFYSLSARSSTFIEPNQSYMSYGNVSQTPHGLQNPYSEMQPDASSSYSASTADSMPWYLQEWARKNLHQDGSVQNESAGSLPLLNSSTDQDTDSGLQEDVAGDSSKELIGMGLYDLPDSVTGLGSLVEATGKGLKLEETWQPPDEDDEEDDEVEDEESSDDYDEELPPSPPLKQETQPHVPVQIEPQFSNSMAGQSFLFGEEHSAPKDWWCHQFQQPTMSVRDTGIRYGWV